MLKTHITKRDIIIILALTSSAFMLSLLASLFFDKLLPVFATFLFAIIILLFIVEVYKRLKSEAEENLKKVEQLFEQTEALLSIYSSLDIRTPLPKTRGWAASPDILNKIIELLFTKKPAVVVEASSGISTLLTAYCFKKLGHGKVISLEHDAEYAEKTRNMLALHNLSDIATVLHAPLKEYSINNEKWLWYDLSALNPEITIDMFLIDGPPSYVQNLARYPAIPLLYSKLNPGAFVILDDGDRIDETAIAARWQKEFSELSSEYIEVEKGAFFLTKK